MLVATLGPQAKEDVRQAGHVVLESPIVVLFLEVWGTRTVTPDKGPLEVFSMQVCSERCLLVCEDFGASTVLGCLIQADQSNWEPTRTSFCEPTRAERNVGNPGDQRNNIFLFSIQVNSFSNLQDELSGRKLRARRL